MAVHAVARNRPGQWHPLQWCSRCLSRDRCRGHPDSCPTVPTRVRNEGVPRKTKRRKAPLESDRTYFDARVLQFDERFGVSFESKHGSLASHKPRSEQADDTDMRTNVIENRARLQVLRQCLLDWWFVFSARVVHLKARVEVGPQSLSKSTRDSEPDIA